MKLRDIFLLISCCFAVLSCSMEDDTIMNDVEKNIEETTGEMYTVIDFGLGFTEMATKSATVETGDPILAESDGKDSKERTISSFDIFLLEDNNIIGIIRNNGQIDGESINDIKLKSSEFITKYKVGRILTAYIVINATVYADEEITLDPFSSVKIGDDISKIDKSIVSNHLTAESLIKVGKKIITIDKTYPKASSPKAFTDNYFEGEYQPKNIQVNVSHLAARLEFSKFSCELKGFGEGATVRLVNAEFRNIQAQGYINGDKYESFVPASTVGLKTGMDVVNGSVVPNLRAYSYRNQGLDKRSVELFVKFEVTDKGATRSFEKTYTINPPVSEKNVTHDYVMGGYLYDIEVNWTITPTWADSSIEFYTKDWVLHFWDMGDI